MQTSPDNLQRAVCYIPDKRTELLNFQQQHAALSLKDGERSPNKRNAGEMDFAVKKKTKVHSTVVDYD